jgi:phosphatidylinositol alpha-1,6-mannosyltransferase
VIAGDSGGAPEAVRDGETGFVVGGTDRAALTDRLVTLLGDAALRSRLGAAGRAWVEREWPWDVAAARLHGYLAA